MCLTTSFRKNLGIITEGGNSMYYFLTEERSMKNFLEILLPKLGFDENYRIISFEGKSDLKKSVSRKINASERGSKFIVLIDQDSNDCMRLKQEIREIIEKQSTKVGEIEYRVRIVCHELESWYLGDLFAVDKAFGTKMVQHINKRTYRNPDYYLSNPKQVFLKQTGTIGQIAAAEKMANAMTMEGIKNNQSHSFRVFISTVKGKHFIRY
jgi:hypothetical protein